MIGRKNIQPFHKFTLQNKILKIIYLLTKAQSNRFFCFHWIILVFFVENDLRLSIKLGLNSLGISLCYIINFQSRLFSDSLLSKVGITLFLWEVQFVSIQNPTEKTSKFYMGLFDLNAWYQVK